MKFDPFTLWAHMGLVLDFLAFFMVTPELLGERRLRSVQRFLRSALIWMSLGFLILSIANVVLTSILYILLPLLLSLFPTEGLVSSTWALFMIVVFAADRIASLTGFPWWVGHLVVFLIGGIGVLFSWLSNKIMNAVIRLSNEERARQNLLKLGAILFMLGTLLQFAETFR